MTKNKGRFTRERVLGDKNPKWKGDNVGYYALHVWVSRNFGKVKKCEDCDSVRAVHWANISKQYKRDRDDWKQLCQVCHFRFDGITRFSKEQAEVIRYRNLNGESQRKLAKELGVSQGTISNVVVRRGQFYAK